MPRETSKSVARRIHDSKFAIRYFVGEGIDIGAGNDFGLAIYQEAFPLIKRIRMWDKPDGDAALLESVENETYDFVHASHCIEHLDNPKIAMDNWIRVCKKGGHLIILCPDEDIFEQGYWPSRFSGTDHKTSWTIGKEESWCPQSYNLIDFLKQFLDRVSIQKIELLDDTYLYRQKAMDQTSLSITESAIEVILRKRTDKEILEKGRLPEKSTTNEIQIPSQLLDVRNNPNIIKPLPSNTMFNYKT